MEDFGKHIKTKITFSKGGINKTVILMLKILANYMEFY